MKMDYESQVSTLLLMIMLIKRLTAPGLITCAQSGQPIKDWSSALCPSRPSTIVARSVGTHVTSSEKRQRWHSSSEEVGRLQPEWPEYCPWELTVPWVRDVCRVGDPRSHWWEDTDDESDDDEDDTVWAVGAGMAPHIVAVQDRRKVRGDPHHSQRCDKSKEEDCDAGVSWWKRATGGRQPANALLELPHGEDAFPAPVADLPSLCPDVPQMNGSAAPPPPSAGEDIHHPPHHISSYVPSPVWDIPMVPGPFSGAADMDEITTILACLTGQHGAGAGRQSWILQ
ncbi:uncharacterized protein LOC114786878 [Denticeps clupeoides]|uniref:uncharacterized protein LOC114786878 n=1 Tax=Denticeps clupeoides TaxID=299321 RepID=UPI0010A45841|nr:uncharacterized protein LOC114786878 [Denticeps clupeoides]